MRRYRARQRAAGLKPSTRWQAVAAPPLTSAGLENRVIEVRTLAMHCLMAQKIHEKPALLDKARRNLEQWCSRYGQDIPGPVEEWREILARPWPEIAAFMTDPGERASRLRKSTPFRTILTETERERVYRAFRTSPT
jgi:hypothetical protein